MSKKTKKKSNVIPLRKTDEDSWREAITEAAVTYAAMSDPHGRGLAKLVAEELAKIGHAVPAPTLPDDWTDDGRLLDLYYELQAAVSEMVDELPFPGSKKAKTG